MHILMDIVIKDDSFYVVFNLMDHRVYSNHVAIYIF